MTMSRDRHRAQPLAGRRDARPGRRLTTAMLLCLTLALAWAAATAPEAAAARSASPAADTARHSAPRPDSRARRPSRGSQSRGSPSAADRRRRDATRRSRRGGVRRCSPAGIRALRGTSREERRVRCLLNRHRARARLVPLRYDRCLDRAAERHARDMVRRGFFAHASHDGRGIAQRIRAAGYLRRAASWQVAENIAWGAGARGSAHATVHGWLVSRPHRRNIFASGFRDVGVAVVRGAPTRDGGRSRPAPATYVVEFGARSNGRPRCGRTPTRR